MIRMNKTSRKLMEEHFPEFFEITDRREALLKLHEYIVLYGMDSDDYKNELGYRLEDVCDDVYFGNSKGIKGEELRFLPRLIGKKIVRRTAVPIEYVKEALQNPVTISEVKMRKTGERSIQFISDKCVVSVNPDTGMLLQTNLI